MVDSKVNDILVFLAVVDAGNFVAGGKTFGLSRSTAGKAIARLENIYGVRLLNRTTRSLTLTDEGRKLYQHGQEIQSALEATNASMQGTLGYPSGLLRITAPDALGRQLLLPIVQQFLRQWPEVRVEIRFSDSVDKLVEEGFDLAIRVGVTPPDHGLIARTILTDRPVLCAAPDYFHDRKRPASIEQLSSHELLQFCSGTERQVWTLVDENGLQVSVQGKIRLRMDSAAALRDTALAGFGIALLPRLLIKTDIAAGRLEPVLPRVDCGRIPVLALYPHKRLLEPRVRQFIDLMVEQLREPSATGKSDNKE